jgi:hypothetical protein
VAIEDFSRTKNNRTDVANLATMGANLGEVVVDVAGHIVRGVLIFGAFAINRGLHQPDRLNGRVKWDENNIIDTLQSGEGAGPQGIIEARPTRALVDMLLVGQRNNQQITESAGLLEMNDMALMHEIKGGVALHETLTPLAFGIQDGFRLGKTQDFIFFHSSERAISFVKIWQTTI